VIGGGVGECSGFWEGFNDDGISVGQSDGFNEDGVLVIDGLLDGLFDGLTDGFVEGDSDGLFEGWSVWGRKEGTTVGRLVGIIVEGKDDGVFVTG